MHYCDYHDNHVAQDSSRYGTEMYNLRIGIITSCNIPSLLQSIQLSVYQWGTQLMVISAFILRILVVGTLSQKFRC